MSKREILAVSAAAWRRSSAAAFLVVGAAAGAPRCTVTTAARRSAVRADAAAVERRTAGALIATFPRCCHVRTCQWVQRFRLGSQARMMLTSRLSKLTLYVRRDSRDSNIKRKHNNELWQYMYTSLMLNISVAGLSIGKNLKMPIKRLKRLVFKWWRQFADSSHFGTTLLKWYAANDKDQKSSRLKTFGVVTGTSSLHFMNCELSKNLDKFDS